MGSRGPAEGRRSYVWWSGCIAAVVVYFVGARLTGSSAVWTDACWIAVDVFATATCFLTYRQARARQLRIAWAYITAACACWTAAMLVWAYLELVRGELTPFPSATDVLGWLGSPLFLAGMFYYKPRETSRTLGLKQLGELALIASALVAVAVGMLAAPAMSAHFSAVYIATALLSPVVGVTSVVFGLISLASYLAGARRRVMAWLLGGIFILAATSALYAKALLAGEYQTGNSWFDVIWIVAFLAIATAAHQERRIDTEPERTKDEQVGRFDTLVPAGALGAWASVLVFGGPHRLVIVNAVTGAIVILALSLRIWATQRLERVLTERIAREEVRAWELEVRLARAHKLEAVGTLAGGVAHDFNNVLASATGGLKLVRRKLARGVPVERDLDEIEAVLWRASDLTSRLLDLARKREPNRIALDPHGAVARAHMLLDKVLPAGVHLRLGEVSNVPAIVADPGGLEHALLNLGLNARDALREHGGTITIGVRRNSSHADFPGEVVVFEVRDDGPGIHPDHLSHLFEPFFTTKAEHEGTGLGLAMVEAFAIANGGVVSVTSALGEGTTFQLAFAAVAERPAGESLPAMSGMVLVVAGEDPTGLATTGALERCGFTTIVVRDAVAALEAIERQAIRAIVVDAAIGLADGEAVRALRAAGGVAPIVLVTSAEVEDLGEWAAVVRTPIDPGAMAERLRHVIARRDAMMLEPA